MKVKAHFWAAAILPLAAGLIAIFCACTPVHVGGEIVLKGDGSGSRKIAIYIYDYDEHSGGGNAYNYLRVHGDELKAAVEQKLRTALKDISWLDVSISQGYGAMYNCEIVTLSFNFANFKEYTDRMSRLAKFGRAGLPMGSEYRTPTLKKAANNQWRFYETGRTSVGVVRPLFDSIFNDPNLFDETSKGSNTEFDKGALSGMLQAEAVWFTAYPGSNPPRLYLSGSDIDETFPQGE